MLRDFQHSFLIVLISCSALIMAPAHALQFEDYVERKKNLISLAGIFGELHHIRRTCSPNLESTIWRKRMQNMVTLEAPDNDTHLKMVTAFNDGFQRAKSRFPQCNRAAQETGKDLAFKGSSLVRSLTDPLIEDTPIQSVETF